MKISIITVVYNNLECIETAIASKGVLGEQLLYSRAKSTALPRKPAEMFDLDRLRVSSAQPWQQSALPPPFSTRDSAATGTSFAVVLHLDHCECPAESNATAHRPYAQRYSAVCHKLNRRRTRWPSASQGMRQLKRRDDWRRQTAVRLTRRAIRQRRYLVALTRRATRQRRYLVALAPSLAIGELGSQHGANVRGPDNLLMDWAQSWGSTH